MPQPVGRPPWTTPEQFEYLQNLLPNLDSEKANNGLTQFYARVARDFSLKWEPPIIKKDHEKTETEDGLKKLAYERRGRVSQHFSSSEPLLTVTNSRFPSGSKNTAKTPPLPLSPSLFWT